MYVSGLNLNRNLWVSANSKTQTENPCVSPPIKCPIDPSNILSFSVGSFHSAFVTNDGRAFCIGDDTEFLIGTGTAVIYYEPIEITFPEIQDRFVDVCCGEEFTLYLTSGDILVYVHKNCTRRIPAFHKLTGKPIFITAGTKRAGAIDDNGYAFIFSSEDPYEQPKRIRFVEPIFDLCIGDSDDLPFVVFLTKSRKIFGNQTYNNDSDEFGLIESMKAVEFRQLCAGHDHLLALTSKGLVYSSGLNSFGQLGVNYSPEKNKFNLIENLADYTIKSIATGKCHSLFVTESGSLFGCGIETGGRLPTKSSSNEKYFTPFLIPLNGFITHAWAGSFSSVILIGYEPPIHRGFMHFFLKNQPKPWRNIINWKEILSLQYEIDIIEQKIKQKEETKLNNSKIMIKELNLDDLNALIGIEEIGISQTSQTIKVINKNNDKISIRKLLPGMNNEILHQFVKDYKEIIEINHPCFARIYGYSDNCILREAINTSLYQQLFFGKMSPTVKSRIITEIVLGLKYMHSKGLAHLNLKPENILLDEYHHVKLIDYGFANPFAKVTTCVAPEIFNNEDFNEKADIYSLGKLLEIMFSMNSANESEKESENYKDLISKCISQNPADRPSINDVYNELKQNHFVILPKSDGTYSFESCEKIEKFEKLLSI
ncbi:hypothetical protein TRFO_07766 [Tritrichomonas foetus]|uniref:Protein kinase domain-containing protein n=1 Tax=Tritrichomonas foetus TaxID=1144522 RepID=A0A1J4JP15_9EUKA|nr:hypothetical protein TRFO_07766 [Tritrichomonas foetus]|eukprot:OHT00787.1 hypothetical protein TRFO_07766 [Tritrichomonas foetus]